MEITHTKKSDIVIVKLIGRLDALSSDSFEKELLDLMEKDEKKFVIDFAQLDFISSSGLRVLMIPGKKLTGVGGKVVLCALKGPVREVFDIAGFTVLFNIFPSLEEAMQALE